MESLAIVIIYENKYIDSEGSRDKEVEEIIRLGNGVELFIDDTRILLDPRRAEGLSFVSHAHSDHAPSKVSGEVISTEETGELLSRHFSTLVYEQKFENLGVSFRLIPSGHMLGSSQVVIENGFKVIYTGDLHLEGGATSGMGVVERCDILIIESTFGSPFYILPDREYVLGEIKDWIEDCFSRGDVPVLLGYSLGKAQEIIKLLSGDYKLGLHRAVYENCRKYEALGVNLGSYELYSENIREEKEDRVLIFPPAARNSLKGNFKKALLSGWALHGATKFKFRVDEAFAISDHSDFNGLVNYVEKASPQVIYTLHGFAEEFSDELKERGFYANPLTKKQTGLNHFL